jgi:hypothetical protein
MNNGIMEYAYAMHTVYAAMRIQYNTVYSAYCISSNINPVKLLFHVVITNRRLLISFSAHQLLIFVFINCRSWPSLR